MDKQKSWNTCSTLKLINDTLSYSFTIMEETMKLFTVLLVGSALLFSTSAMALDFGQHHAKPRALSANGPAPNSGDGIPDGSGNDAPFGPNAPNPSGPGPNGPNK